MLGVLQNSKNIIWLHKELKFNSSSCIPSPLHIVIIILFRLVECIFNSKVISKENSFLFSLVYSHCSWISNSIFYFSITLNNLKQKSNSPTKTHCQQENSNNDQLTYDIHIQLILLQNFTSISMCYILKCLL